jgi:hypothetical protein
MFIILTKIDVVSGIKVLADPKTGKPMMWRNRQEAIDYGEGKVGVPALILTVRAWRVVNVETMWASDVGVRYKCENKGQGNIVRSAHPQDSSSEEYWR